MNVRLLGLAMALGLALPVAAHAQMLQPGLWELTTSNMKVDEQNMPDLQLILGQLQSQMTPQQRAMLEKQGITMGGKGIRACLTPEQVKTDNIPLTDPQSGCKQEITDRSGNQWKSVSVARKPRVRAWRHSSVIASSPPRSTERSTPPAFSRRAASNPAPSGWGRIAVL